MSEMPEEKMKLGVSTCLLGEKVRFDGGHKRNTFLTQVLVKHFELIPFCPEVEIGLGIPREPIRLVEEGYGVRCVGTKDASLDVTDRLTTIADVQKSWHADLCGYVLKRDSPSCGMERVKIYGGKVPKRKGIGLYAMRLMENFPELPVEEEGRLSDPVLRENFIQRVFVYSRWKTLKQSGLSIAKLQAFHAQHKYMMMSHNQDKARELGAMLAKAEESIDVFADHYIADLMALLKFVATRRNHTNTLQHIQGYLKEALDASDKQEINEMIDDYRQGLLPLIVPITLLRHHFRRHPNSYIMNTLYMNPHPRELMLLNSL